MKVENLLYETLFKSGRFPEYGNLLEFFEKGFSLTHDDRWSKFDLSFSPWYQVLCEWWEDPDVEWIYLVQGSQTSKTTFMMGALLYTARYTLGAVPTMWIQSTEEEAKTFVRERLKPFLDGASNESIKNWRQEYFRIGNAPVKVGFGTSIQSLRCMPVRFVFGDECGIWKVPIAYAKKRTRTFEGQRKGVFCTTPPFDSKHFSWKEATVANFHQWWIPCPRCKNFHALKFTNLIFSEAMVNGNWDHGKIREVIRHKCEHCGYMMRSDEKLEAINGGKAVCVDPETYKPIEMRSTSFRTLQISGLYSPATHWSSIACDFLDAKAGGADSLRVFFTDELAEVPKEFGEKISDKNIELLIDEDRRPCFHPDFDLYTAGVDVQRLGELYVVIMGWKRGSSPSGHVLDYFTVGWLGQQGQPDWVEFLEEMEEYKEHLSSCCIDATDGVVSQSIYDFCTDNGAPYVALRDTTTSQKKVEYKRIDDFRSKSRSRRISLVLYMTVNSDMVKDDIAIALGRPPDDPEAWSFHAETDSVFFKHLGNEHRISEKAHGRERATWKPKYAGAPQHYLSALVYAVAGMEQSRLKLQQMNREPVLAKPKRDRIISAGIDPYAFGDY